LRKKVLNHCFNDYLQTPCQQILGSEGFLPELSPVSSPLPATTGQKPTTTNTLLQARQKVNRRCVRTSGDSRIKKVGGPLRGQGKSRGAT